MILKNEYPVLEYSTERGALINPQGTNEAFPRLCLVSFFAETVAAAVEKYDGRKIGAYRSEVKPFGVYRICYNGMALGLVQAAVGAGSAAMLTDWLYGRGAEAVVCCGGCGVLSAIPAGTAIIPVRALRDEGASYKYLPPSRFIEMQAAPVEAFKKILAKHGVPYIACTTWTTDGFFRETREMVEYRRAEGCQVVEMECAAMAAVAQLRNRLFGQLLYSGDILAGDDYDDRGWYHNFAAREKLFLLALEALTLL